ncbi:hypothetical protein NC651_001452 [Populus alba x Populus x berolinensis]|nr:hypothetical protein NC651_001452 [Populus alba x Populus x berolinensis]
MSPLAASFGDCPSISRRLLPSSFSGEVYSLSINAWEENYEKGISRIHTSGDRPFR